MTPDMAAEMAVNAVLKYLRDSGLVDEAQQDAWIAKVYALVKERKTQVN